MSSVRIIRVFDQLLEKAEALSFIYTPQMNDIQLKGILLSTNICLSLTFEDGTDLSLNQQTDFNSLWTAPDKRIIRFERPLNGRLIKGIVSENEQNTWEIIPARVYFLVK